jgi:spore germination protein YaaH
MPKLLLLLFSAAPLFAQLESHTLAISASRSINLQPDQVVFGLTVSSAATASLDQIVSALAGLGITSASLAGVNNYSAPTTFQWNFTLAAPVASLSATIGALTKLQQTIAQNNSGLTLTFAINGTQVSQQLQESQSCSNSDLIADATAQGQKLAAAAGLTLGPILRVSNVPVNQNYAVPSIVGRLGSSVSGVLFASFSDFLVSAPLTPVTCSLLVTFQLLP